MRALGWVAYLIVAAWVGYARLWPMQDWITPSFAGYWVVARAVADGFPVVDLYDTAVLGARMQADGMALHEEMIGPPSLTLTLLPLASLPYVEARRLWLWGVCFPALVLGFAFATRRAGPAGPLLASGFLLSAPASDSLRVGQVYPLFLLLHLLALWATERGRLGLAGLGVAPMMAMRGWYGLTLVVGWALSGRLRAAIVALGATIVLVLASIPLVGIEAWSHFFLAHLSKMSANPWAGSAGYQTLRSFALHITTPGPWLGSPIVDLPALGPSLAGALSLTVAWSGWRLVRIQPHPALLVAGMTTMGVLLSPFTQEYHFLLAALPAGVVLAQPSAAARILCVLALGLLLPGWHYQGEAVAHGWRALLAYPRLFGALLLHAAVLLAAQGRFQLTPTPPPIPVRVASAQGIAPK